MDIPDQHTPPKSAEAVIGQPIVTARRAGTTAQVSTGAGLVLLSLDDDLCQPIVLSGSSALIWEHLSTDFVSINDVIHSVAKDAGLTEESVGNDVVEFIRQMGDLGVVDTAN